MKDNVIAVSTGGTHTVAITTDGGLWAWGRNNRGQLGDGTRTDRYSPLKIMDGVYYVSAGGVRTMALKSDGSLWGWGDNRHGQLGDGTTRDRNRPVNITSNILTPSL